MKDYINDIGTSICPLVALGQVKFLTGHLVYNQWFGYHDMHTGLIRKAQMAIYNG